jgi:hypothetical protein
VGNRDLEILAIAVRDGSARKKLCKKKEEGRNLLPSLRAYVET